MVVHPLVPKSLYHVFDAIKVVATGVDLSDASLVVAKQAFGKVAQILIKK